MRVLWVFAAVALALPLPGRAQEPSGDPPCPAIVVTGEGTARAAPDRAFVNVTAEARAREPEAAQQEAARAMSSVYARLEGLGVGRQAIRTIRYDLQPEYDRVDGRRTLRGYVARNTIEVRVDDLSRVGTLIAAAVGSGATSITSVRFDLAQRDELERAALQQAVLEARKRVDAAASSAGVAVERVWSIEENRLRYAPPVPMMSARADAAQELAPPVSAGPIEVSAAVTLTACIR